MLLYDNLIIWTGVKLDTAKTHLWMKRVSNLLGEDYAKELAATYVTYTLPHTQAEKDEMIEMKHHQMFTKEFNRWTFMNVFRSSLN